VIIIESKLVNFQELCSKTSQAGMLDTIALSNVEAVKESGNGNYS